MNKRPVDIENTGHSIILNGYYEIALSRIPDERGLCEWIHHLGEKSWMDAEAVRQIIGEVFAAKGWTLYKHL